MSDFPKSPDGMYHYRIGYHLHGVVGGANIRVKAPILASENDPIYTSVVTGLAWAHKVTDSEVIITSVSLLAVPWKHA